MFVVLVVSEFTSEKSGEEVGHRFSKVKATYYSHDTEVIFAFPSMYMNLKTSHFQDERPPAEDGMFTLVFHQSEGCSVGSN